MRPLLLLRTLSWLTAIVLSTVTSSLAAHANPPINQQTNPQASVISPPVRPNFVIIILDDWGWRESGAYGNPDIHTPHIDQLAQQGLQFHSAFLTASTCTPSRASILTGLHPFASGAHKLHVPVPADRVLFSQLLRDAGYFTAAVGKWHLGEEVKPQFDRVIEERQTDDQSQTGMEDWLEVIQHQLPAGQPFFLWLAAKDPHKPWHHDPQWAKHQAENMKPAANIEFNANHPPQVVRQQMALYYDEISRADFFIGQVVDALRQQRQLDNTVLILMSDNGAPFWKAKKFLTDPGLKTPFIVHWPTHITQHRDIHELISAVDIAPTLLTLAGVTPPEHLEGYSFAPWLRDEATIEPIRETVYGERGDGLLLSENGRSIRDQHYLYIVDDYPHYTECDDPIWTTRQQVEYLYNVKVDPDNVNNLLERRGPLQNLWQRVSGQQARQQKILQQYRQQMLQRRTERNDLPAKVIEGMCYQFWHQAEPHPHQDQINNPSPADD